MGRREYILYQSVISSNCLFTYPIYTFSFVLMFPRVNRRCTVYEVFERMAVYGISSNLFIYLTKKLHQGTVTSANNVTNWVGTVWMTPILGAYFADAVLGRYWTLVIACAIYLSVRLHVQHHHFVHNIKK